MRPINPHTKTVGDLARFLSLESESAISFSGLTSSTKNLESGDLFIAMPGFKTHGAQFIDEAIRKGAVAVLTDDKGAEIIGDKLPLLRTQEVRGVTGDVAAWFYGRPFSALSTIGITGTNGKTTTASLLFQLWQAQNRVVGMIGTVGITIDLDTYPGSFTTPEAPELQETVAAMRERCLTHLVMEVSSHALSEKRVRGAHFDIAAFTNLTQDHLDFHGTMESYFAAKALLFTQEYASEAIINIDDPWGEKLAAHTALPMTSLSREKRSADWHYTSIHRLASGGYDLSIRGIGGILIEGRTHLVGDHNLDNLLMAVAIGYASGLDPLAMGHDFAQLRGAPGRLESINLGQKFLALVDFAHTPDAVARALQAVREVTAGCVIAVLGCGGDRDPGKRPLMGAALVQGSDYAIFTSDNPRSEDPNVILREMVNGISEGENIAIEVNRRSAIALAVMQAMPGDTVVILGKGHEKGQEIHGVKEPFDDRIELAKAIEELA